MRPHNEVLLSATGHGHICKQKKYGQKINSDKSPFSFDSRGIRTGKKQSGVLWLSWRRPALGKVSRSVPRVGLGSRVPSIRMHDERRAGATNREGRESPHETTRRDDLDRLHGWRAPGAASIDFI
jgi:hypothetical protein